ncbi:hypothetical protein CCH79_00014119, partial [Gambusia affinis]
AGCSIKPEKEECPNECSDQGRCVDGKCVCFPGYSGPDCSESGCPGNCKDHGRCVNGECVCDPGFSGPDCSQKACPDNCSNRGRCVNGKCICNSGSTGPSCSERSCPKNCNRRGRCVDGQCMGRCVDGKCVCDTGSTGPDCSEVTCPGNCNDRGRCVDGKCVCDTGSTGPDCSEVTCPGNCNDRGRCVDGECVCDDGFTGEDCQARPCPNDCNDRGRCVDGQCVCDNGFTGTDCTETTCPGNCNNRGRCINGQCVCDNGFTGADCSEKTCPDNCSNRGTCVDGRCVCESNFSGDDCSEYACPENCKNRGRCINGQCVCNEGFTGEDCSEKGCPNNCNNHGRCVNGKCVCGVPFTGPDCSIRGCPKDCSNKGRCIKGQCVCRRGFTGPDCSQCKEGLTGPNCNIAMASVSQLGVQDVTDSSATLIWTQPAVQYETYHITFTSQKEKDQQITVQVDGSLTTFTQTGLAAGQEYIVTIVGEINGRRGVESTAEFLTLISSPTNLQVVKTTSTSAVVQWEESQADIDRYRLTITPKDGAGRSQDMTIGAGQNSAHIQQLEAGRLYDILLVAEKGVVRSQPATTQVVPGTAFPRATIEVLTMQVTQAPGRDLGSKSRDSSSFVSARTRPLVRKVAARNDTRPKTRRPMVTKAGLFRPNATRVLPGGRRFLPDSKHKTPVVLKKTDETKADVQVIRESVADRSEETLRSERSGNQSPAVIPRKPSSPPSEPNRESSSEELFSTGSKGQPDADMAKNNTNSVSSEPNGNIRSQEKKCMNKIKKTSADKQTKESDNRDDILIKLEAPIDSDIKERSDIDRDIGATNQSSISVKPVTLPNRQPTSRTVIGEHHGSQSIDGIEKKEFPKANPIVNTVFDTETDGTKGLASEVASSGDEREPLNFVDVTNQTSDGFTVMWGSPEGKYKNFVISRTEVDKDESRKQKENKQEEDKDQDSKEFSSENGGDEDNNKVPKDFQVPITQKGAVDRPTEREKTFRQVLPGSARSHQFEHLPPQTEYTITLLGKGSGILSRLHKLVISTGPEPPSNIMFSEVTENSLTVSWTKPKSSVDGFKVTYTHADEGEPVSVTVGSRDSTLDLSQLSPGSSYEVTIISTLGLDESDPIKDTVMTLPDPPTALQAVNVTDSTALLLWRPALASVDKYTIVYGSGTGSEVRVTISGNAAEQQLSNLEGSTTYTVTVRSELGNLESSPATTSFTTKRGSGRDQNEPQDLKAINVTPRSAVVSWIPLSRPVDKYILVYRIKGESPQEIIVGSDLTQYELTRLHPGSLYIVELRSIRGGQPAASSNTEFTTGTSGTLKFPFPTDCSQELLNGVVSSNVVEIFPQGKLGKSMNVSCDMETDGGGWTVFQRRKDGSVEFYNGWKDYVSGFGNLSGEFWLGLENIHNLTKMTKMNLRVDLRDGSEQVFARYSTFEVSNRNYKLSVGGYSGTAGDSLNYHNNCVFSTKDRDPAPWITRCAISYQGGWWYKNCHQANLNGRYGIDYKHQGVIWKSWKGEHHSIQFTEMKMRPASFRPPASRTK